eukprot:ANDGO_00038.mRNA.1 hypothetical protein
MMLTVSRSANHSVPAPAAPIAPIAFHEVIALLKEFEQNPAMFSRDQVDDLFLVVADALVASGKGALVPMIQKRMFDCLHDASLSSPPYIR